MQKNHSKIALAYCADNQAYADQIQQELAPVADFQMVAISRDQGTSLTQTLAAFTGPIVLLLSDNFLRSTKCMEQGLTMLNTHQNRILPVVIPGYQVQEDGSKEVVETSFERVSDIIQYINFWQDRYLDLRRQKREDPDLDNPGFSEHLRIVRDISGEAGEHIRLLRGMLHLDWQEFTYKDYEQLFIFLDEEELGAEFHAQRSAGKPTTTPEEEQATPSQQPQPQPQLEEEPPVNIADIPGIGMLPREEELSQPAVPQEVAAAGEEKAASPVTTDTESQAEDLDQLIQKAWRLVDHDAAATGLNLLETALDQYPGSEQLRYHYALVLTQEDQTDAAMAQVELILQNHPDDQDALFLAGELADIQGDGQQAKRYYQRVLSVNEDYAEAWYQLGNLVLTYEPTAAEEAVGYFKKAIKLDDSYSDAYYRLGVLYRDNLANPEKALKYLEKTIATDSTHPLAQYDLALLYHQHGEFKKAYQAYLAAIQINPEVKTPENDTAFSMMAQKTDLQQEQNTLQALKDNIQHLEELIRHREEIENLPPEKEGAGKYVLITGATAGIGRATAEKFAEAGYRLIITGRRQERLTALKASWEAEYGTEVYTLSFDVRNPAAVFAAIEQLPAAWKNIDILVNNAGKAKGFDPIHTGQIPHWEEMIDTNIKGLLYLTRAVSPGMVARGQGHIINIASTAGKEVYPNGNVYCATKFAVDALTKAMRLDLHTYGIRVSQVCPAAVEETEFALVRFDGDSERAKIYEGFQPLRARDVAATIYFIAQQPPHVNILDVVVQATQQASSTVIDRSGREKYQEEEE
ncbi:MAG: hypothetical protein DA408_06435 [Bacteroidetes bacterium]|nr:MAG: hypothetical protein C7N36_10960 [Bacteroidota bacterium]PTM13479.1 MAG: hypothetical protein DA408_06435 [Bacteroidota bacterium]